MICKKTRTIFNLFTFFSCEGCQYKKEDEWALIGNNIYAVYYLNDNCPHLQYKDEEFFGGTSKFNLLIKDAILYNSQIIFLFFEEFQHELYYRIFEKIMDEGLDVQILTIK